MSFGTDAVVSMRSDAPLPPTASQLRRAAHDVVRGACAAHIWRSLGWQDIRLHYRRSMLGPFWLTISMGLLVGMLSALYGVMFKVDVVRYTPFLALGFIVWTFISGVIADASRVFINAQSIITQTNLPLSVHVYRVVWRNFIILGHNALIFPVVAVLLAPPPNWTGLLAAPGLVLLYLNGIWTGLLLGLASARFRDVPPIVDSILRILFFVTPVIWMPEFLPERIALLDWNPFFHFLEVVRAPLLGQPPALRSWLMVLGVTVGGSLLTFLMYVRYRRRIAYWV